MDADMDAEMELVDDEGDDAEGDDAEDMGDGEEKIEAEFAHLDALDDPKATFAETLVTKNLRRSCCF